MRCFFHLVRSGSRLIDEEGLEVANMDEIRAEVTKATQELRQANPFAVTDWKGWRLEVTDASGTVLFTFDLGPAPLQLRRRCR